MDPNANLAQQESILESLYALDAKEPDAYTNYERNSLLDELVSFRQDLDDWLRSGGFEPDWSKAPKARVYFMRVR
jgi:hypothetical protein